ncbi:MAG: putative lipid II flippase FtsW [Actinomycetota bacterium]
MSGRSSSKRGEFASHRAAPSRGGSGGRRTGTSRGSGRSGTTRAADRRSGSRRSGTKRRKPSLKVTDVGERYAAYLTLAFVGLTLFGLVMVLSASSVSSLHQYDESPFYQFKRQAAWAGIGAIAFLITSRLDYRLLQRLAGFGMLVSLGLLVALLIPGVGITRNSSTRWLGAGPLVIQPSELAKLALILFIADLLARRERRMDRSELTVRPVMIVVYVCSGLIILQPKLGTPVILGAIALILLFVAGARIKSLLTWTLLSVGAVAALALTTGYQRSRIDGWLNPWESPQGIGLQAIQSQVGIASGGLFGQGLGASRAKWGFLPFAHTDFIFAIVAEEVGLIGASALIAAFVLIAWFGVRAALAAPDRFGMLLAAGVTSWLVFQAFLNIGMVLGVLPITGEALPFVSAGGSNLVTTLTAAGLLTSVARRAKDPATIAPTRRTAKRQSNGGRRSSQSKTSTKASSRNGRSGRGSTRSTTRASSTRKSSTRRTPAGAGGRPRR